MLCASCIFLLLMLVPFALKMGTDGLPINRRERGVHQDIIAGEDFLSVLMESPALRQAYRELSTTETTRETRLTRSTSSVDLYKFTPIRVDLLDGSSEVTPSPKANSTKSDLIVSIDMLTNTPSFQTDKMPPRIEPYIVEVTTAKHQDSFVEEHPNLLSDTNKSEFNVEETEPITFPDYLQDYTSKVDSSSSDYSGVTQSQSIIYHSSPMESNRGRSVSYSTVIQALPKQAPVNWNDESHSPQRGERKERHYNLKGAPNEDKFDKSEEKHKSKQSTSWNKQEQHYTSTETNWEMSEKDHAQREKPYVAPFTSDTLNHNLPIIYGKPEENYEVDEAVSVMSSGRVHGVQPLNKNDNPKVGYVVEGRNYRKYRVEERTSDGFIVGEYGIVSHDDGSLRGVRYTADGTINPRLIYDALMKFLSL